MMKNILSFGSLNIDYVYRVDDIVHPGETLASHSYQKFPGGKGANQSVAMGLAGANVTHAGALGTDGTWLIDELKARQVDTKFIQIHNTPSGHAMIQVSENGENAIVLYSGANHCISPNERQNALAAFGAGDILVLQNEINGLPELVDAGFERGMQIVVNPSPFNASLRKLAFSKIWLCVLNETEANQLVQLDRTFQLSNDPNQTLDALQKLSPQTRWALTLGSQGVMFRYQDNTHKLPAVVTKVVDTTGAGDTFTGYLVAGLAQGKSIERSLEFANQAAALCVAQAGAMSSIPTFAQVQEQFSD